MHFTTRVTRRTFLMTSVAGGVAVSAGMLAFGPAVMAQDATPVPYEAPENIGELEGSFEADGSSTLGPLTEAAIEEFAAIAPSVGRTTSRSNGMPHRSR